jgi:phytol kinase
MDHGSPSTASGTHVSGRSPSLATVSIGSLSTNRPGVVALPSGLSAAEIKRRLLHILPGFLPFLLWVIPHRDPWGPLLADVVIVLTGILVGLAFLRCNAFARDGESDWQSSVLGYAVPVLATLCIFRGREEIGVTTLAILAFGDGSATLGGLLMGGRPLPWNRRKSWAGSLCFVVFGAPLAMVIFWGEARPAVSWETAALIAAGATTAAAIAESLPVRINDNLRVGTTAALVGGALTLLVVG